MAGESIYETYTISKEEREGVILGESENRSIQCYLDVYRVVVVH